MREGAEAARAALEQDPADAETYLLLGAALQETSRWQEARAVFATCARRASSGETGECRALAR